MTSSSHRATSAYANVGAQTQGGAAHDPYQLVALMFDSVLQSIAAARGAMQKNDLNGKLKAVDKAMRVLQMGLRTSLDLDNGGELAANLAALYDYCAMRLVQANARNDEAVLVEVSDLLKPVAQGWSEIRPGQSAPAVKLPPAEPVAAAEAQPVAPARRLNSIYGAATPAQGMVAVRA